MRIQQTCYLHISLIHSHHEWDPHFDSSWNLQQQQHARDGQPLASFLPHHESSFEESAAEASSKPISSKLEAENANAYSP